MGSGAREGSLRWISSPGRSSISGPISGCPIRTVILGHLRLNFCSENSKAELYLIRWEMKPEKSNGDRDELTAIKSSVRCTMSPEGDFLKTSRSPKRPRPPNVQVPKCPSPPNVQVPKCPNRVPQKRLGLAKRAGPPSLSCMMHTRQRESQSERCEMLEKWLALNQNVWRMFEMFQ